MSENHDCYSIKRVWLTSLAALDGGPVAACSVGDPVVGDCEVPAGPQLVLGQVPDTAMLRVRGVVGGGNIFAMILSDQNDDVTGISRVEPPWL